MNKLLLAAAVCIGSLAVSESTSQAGDCYYGRGAVAARPVYRSGYAYRPPAVVPRAYYGTYHAYRAPVGSFVSPGYRPYSSYRPGYGFGPGYGGYIGPNIRFGGYPGYGYGRSGISIGIGF